MVLVSHVVLAAHLLRLRRVFPVIAHMPQWNARPGGTGARRLVAPAQVVHPADVVEESRVPDEGALLPVLPLVVAAAVVLL